MPEIWESGLYIFLDQIIRPPFQPHIITAILNQIQTERDGFDINRSAVKGCSDILLSLEERGGDMTIYRRDLEPEILRESEAFYKAEGEKLLETCGAPEYLQKVRRHPPWDFAS